jgi:hypothetical protein
VDPETLTAYLRGLPNRLEYNLRNAERETVEDLKERAEWWTGGSLTEADLQREGRPYSRRHGAPRRDPRRINRRTGGIQGGWQAEYPQEQGGDLVSGIHNTDPKAAEMEAGTARMFERLPHEAAWEEVEPRREQRLEAALQDAFRLS